MVDTNLIESDKLPDIFKDTYEMTSYPFQLNQLAADESFDMLVLITSQPNGISKSENFRFFSNSNFERFETSLNRFNTVIESVRLRTCFRTDADHFAA